MTFKPYALLLGLLTTHILHAATPVSGIYVGALFGGTYEPNINFTVTDPVGTLNALSIPSSLIPSNITTSSTTGTLGYDILINAAAQIGYRFCDNFRVEIEGLYNKNPYNFLRVGNVTVHSPDTSTGLRIDGGTTSGIGFLNAYYDFLGDGENNLAPYVGLGVGYAYIYNVVKFYYNESLLNPTNTGAKNYGNSPAGQVILGMSYFMDDFFSVGLDARYYATATRTFTTSLGTSYNTHLQVYSVNLFFNGALEFG